MKRLILALILSVFLWVPRCASADYATDKSTCSTASNNVAMFAQLRDENAPRDTLIDKMLALANEKDWPAEATLILLYQIQYAYAYPELAPDTMRKQVYTECMKRRGHTTT